MKLKLKSEYVEKLKHDPLIHGRVAAILGLGPNSLIIPLRKNSRKLIQKDVLIALSKYYGVKESDLVEIVEETEEAEKI